jgi:nitrite reductase/ring-hydroxylating ferredoxin subunit
MTTTARTTDAPVNADPCAIEGISADRRAFLRGAGAALGALALLGLSTEDAMALPVRLMSATSMNAGLAKFPIPTEDGVTFDEANGIILVRKGNNAYAFLSVCPHKDVVKLKWLKAEGMFKCPKHDSTYQPSGEFIDGRATRNMDRLPIKKDGNQLVVDVDKVYESDKMADGWKSAVAAL